MVQKLNTQHLVVVLVLQPIKKLVQVLIMIQKLHVQFQDAAVENVLTHQSRLIYHVQDIIVQLQERQIIILAEHQDVEKNRGVRGQAGAQQVVLQAQM